MSSFGAPLFLFALVLVPLAVLAYLAAQRRRSQYATRFTNVPVLAAVASRTPAWRRHLPPLVALLALVALVVALAKPQRTVAVPRERATVVLVSDVSASMQATDVEPTRLAAASDAAKTFTDALPDQIRLGLVAFDQSSRLLVPPGRDHDSVKNALDALTPGEGTGTGEGLATALEAIRRDGAGGRGRPPAAIVLLSDGKTTAGRDPIGVAREARRLGIPINTVALGTPEGVVQIGPQLLAVPPDPDTMQQIAQVSGGRFSDAPDEDELRTIYERLGSRLGTEPEKRESTATFAGLGLLLLLLAGALSLRFNGRLV
jgi:Ca-activated chloride channel family protein